MQVTNHLLEEAKELDIRDDLAEFRNSFYVPDSTIYLDGNSLGLLSREAEDSLLGALNEWKERGISGWGEGSNPWFFLAETVGAKMARLLGADVDEVIAGNSTTVNLHQLLATLYQPQPGRSKILVDTFCFPSDLCAIQSQIRLHGLSVDETLLTIEPTGKFILDEDMCVSRMVSDVAIIVLPVVVYTTGQLLNVERIARAARERGIIFGLDCSHSIGAVNHAVDNWDVDFAVWCTYKYLNGGPGSSGGLFLNRRHFGIRPGLAGWFGSAKEAQFDLGSDFRPCATAGAMQIGSPNILSMAPLLGSLELFERAGMDRLRQKSLSLTRYMIDLSDQLITEYGIELVTPREDDRRGGHIALRHPEAARICKALKSLGVIPDFRPPDIVRLAPAPLYNSYLDCAGAILAIHNIMNHRLYESFPAGRELIA